MNEPTSSATGAGAIVDALVTQIRRALPGQVAVDAHRGSPVPADALPAIVVADEGETPDTDVPDEAHAAFAERTIGVSIYTARDTDEAAWRHVECIRGLVARAVAADPTAGGHAIDVTNTGCTIEPGGDSDVVGRYAAHATFAVTLEIPMGAATP